MCSSAKRRWPSSRRGSNDDAKARGRLGRVCGLRWMQWSCSGVTRELATPVSVMLNGVGFLDRRTRHASHESALNSGQNGPIASRITMADQPTLNALASTARRARRSSGFWRHSSPLNRPSSAARSLLIPCFPLTRPSRAQIARCHTISARPAVAGGVGRQARSGQRAGCSGPPAVGDPQRRQSGPVQPPPARLRDSRSARHLARTSLIGTPAVYPRWEGHFEVIADFERIRDEFPDTHLGIVGGSIHDTEAEHRFGEELRQVTGEFQIVVSGEVERAAGSRKERTERDWPDRASAAGSS